MKAAVYETYGPSSVLRVEERDRPAPRPGEVLVRVIAAAVTTGDWRLRAAAFPGITWLPGRLMFGIFRPRHPVLGSAFSGLIEACGDGATDFAPGEAVFGFAARGAHAEYLTIPASGAIHRKPAGLDHAEAAALPFGALSALVFLRDFARLSAGQSVLVIGASGGVGAPAVQIARAMGATVTGVAGTPHLDLVRSLGAQRVIDYRSEDFTRTAERYDLVLDTVGVTDFARVHPLLTRGGIFLPLNFGAREALQALRGKRADGTRVMIGVSGDTKQDLAALVAMVEAGELRPVIDSLYPLQDVAAAHERVETRHATGAVVLRIAAEPEAAPGAK